MTYQSPVTKKLSAFVALQASEADILDRFRRQCRTFPPNHELIHEGQSRQTLYILERGWAYSYKMLSDGERQIADFHIPGDFLGLRSILLRKSDHNINALTSIEASEVLTTDLLNGFLRAPRLTAAVLWAAARDEAVLVEHLVDVGRRSGEQRMAHFLLELGARLELVGMCDQSGFDCPLTQYHLADALGLSPVHVNRVLRDLRERGLLTFQKGRVIYGDPERLRDLAGFEATYLDPNGPLLK